MDSSGYVTLSKLSALERQLEVTANNLANANSHGFKATNVLFQSYLHAGGSDESTTEMSYVLDRGSYLDTAQGTLSDTGNPLDIALNGDGWLGYETAEGQQAYGRDGRLALDAQGNLVTLNGARVLDQGGAPIVLPLQAGSNVTIAEDGTISNPDLGVLGRIGVFAVEGIDNFDRIGGGLALAGDGAQIAPAEGVSLRQGVIEGSNVNPVLEVTRLVSIQQAYEQAVNLMNSEDDLTKKMLSRIGENL